MIWQMRNYGGTTVESPRNGGTTRREVKVTAGDLTPIVDRADAARRHGRHGHAAAAREHAGHHLRQGPAASRRSTCSTGWTSSPRQVEITAKIFEVSHDFDFQQGAEGAAEPAGERRLAERAVDVQRQAFRRVGRGRGGGAGERVGAEADADLLRRRHLGRRDVPAPVRSRPDQGRQLAAHDGGGGADRLHAGRPGTADPDGQPRQQHPDDLDDLQAGRRAALHHPPGDQPGRGQAAHDLDRVVGVGLLAAADAERQQHARPPRSTRSSTPAKPRRRSRSATATRW